MTMMWQVLKKPVKSQRFQLYIYIYIYIKLAQSTPVQHRLHYYYFVFSYYSHYYGSHDDANPNPIHNKTFRYFSQLSTKK